MSRGGGGGPLFRGGLAGLLPKACGSLPPAPPAPPGRAELEKKAGEEGEGAGATGQRQEVDGNSPEKVCL